MTGTKNLNHGKEAVKIIINLINNMKNKDEIIKCENIKCEHIKIANIVSCIILKNNLITIYKKNFF